MRTISSTSTVIDEQVRGKMHLPYFELVEFLHGGSNVKCHRAAALSNSLNFLLPTSSSSCEVNSTKFPNSNQIQQQSVATIQFK